MVAVVIELAVELAFVVGDVVVVGETFVVVVVAV